MVDDWFDSPRPVDAPKDTPSWLTRVRAAQPDKGHAFQVPWPPKGVPEAAGSEEPIAVNDPRNIRPLRGPKYHLEDLLAGAADANLQPEVGAVAANDNYTSLREILDAAFAHAATGKGKERHARDLPFDRQPMLVTARQVGVGFTLGQAIKKAGESAGMIERGQYDAAEAECLGAINYLAGAILWVRERKEAA